MKKSSSDGEGAAADDRHAEVEAHRPEVQRVELDDDEAPEREEVRDARQRIAQHAALAQHHQHEVLDAVAQVVEAVLRAGPAAAGAPACECAAAKTTHAATSTMPKMTAPMASRPTARLRGGPYTAPLPELGRITAAGD